MPWIVFVVCVEYQIVRSRCTPKVAK